MNAELQKRSRKIAPGPLIERDAMANTLDAELETVSRQFLTGALSAKETLHILTALYRLRQRMDALPLHLDLRVSLVPPANHRAEQEQDEFDAHERCDSYGSPTGDPPPGDRLYSTK